MTFEIKIMKTGLVVGKFAPFHIGHEHLLAYAYAATDQLVILLYDAPDCTSVPAAVRADWIRAAFPDAFVIEGYNPPPRGVWDEANMQLHEKFIKQFVEPHAITHVFSAEVYGDRLAKILNAEHMRMEKIHADVPLSATVLRRNPDLYERYVQQYIYDDLKRYGDVG